ncbi:peptidoglycan-binding protein [Streptomyces aureocirculatus]|uniref:peptidoglycan-binding protein n=1 Tax=Streptomyces aureocirculatus TaxID=67275 RepID=UPI0004C9D25F|nr:peptidoglycan-binding protein [Streptomyces aureocirculatus]
MEAAPEFEELAPASDCGCPGCVHWRRSGAHSLPPRLGGHPAARGARRALVVAAAASSVLGPGQALPAVASVQVEEVTQGSVQPAGAVRTGSPGAPAGLPGADGPDTPQGGPSALHGAPGAPGRSAEPRTTTRVEIITRAKLWVAEKVPYSMRKFRSDGYRQDCSGFVSMAWDLGGNEWTGSLDRYATRIPKDDLEPGDILLFHNPANPERGSHVTIFGGWTDYTRTYYLAYEQARPHARRQATPYAYWDQGDSYVAYRYKGLRPSGQSASGGAASGPAAARYPGAGHFGPGADNEHVTRLGQMLVARGGARFYRAGPGPGPRWSEADRRATQAFQREQGWTGADADGLPGPTTWAYLVGGKGKDIPGGRAAAGRPGPQAAPPFPGKAHFRPGQSNAHVTLLGRQLLSRGFGTFYTDGPGPRWGEADRRAVEAFQRAQGWRGGAADGMPGPETWRRLFA